MNIEQLLEDTSASAQEIATGSIQTAANLKTIKGASDGFSAYMQEQTALSAEIAADVKAKMQVVNGAAMRAEGLKSLYEQVKMTTYTIQTAVAWIYNVAIDLHVLARNAKIESTHAGSFGRGFAVIADTMSDIAEKTKNKAEEIQHTAENNLKIIEQLSAENAKFVRDMDGIKGKIEETVLSIEGMATMIDEAEKRVQLINGAITEAATAVEQNAVAVNQIQEAIGTIRDLYPKQEVA